MANLLHHSLPSWASVSPYIRFSPHFLLLHPGALCTIQRIFQAVSPENRPGEKRYAKNASQDETYRTSCCSSVPFQPAEGFLRIAAEEDTMKEFPCAPVHELWYPVFPQNQSGRYFPSNPSKTLRFLHSTY